MRADSIIVDEVIQCTARPSCKCLLTPAGPSCKCLLTPAAASMWPPRRSLCCLWRTVVRCSPHGARAVVEALPALLSTPQHVDGFHLLRARTRSTRSRGSESRWWSTSTATGPCRGRWSVRLGPPSMALDPRHPPHLLLSSVSQPVTTRGELQPAAITTACCCPRCVSAGRTGCRGKGRPAAARCDCGPVRRLP